MLSILCDPLRSRRALLTQALALACVAPVVRAAERPLVFGVLNQQSVSRTAQRWNPVLRHLSEKLGREVHLRMGATVIETNAMMGRGEFDFAFTNHNFRAEYDGQYKVIARLSGKPIFGVVAVPASSDIRSLQDLAGLRVAFPSREAFVAYAVPMKALRSAQVKVIEVLASNQDSALAQLKAGAVQAAAVNSRLLTQFAAKQGLAYREVYTSEGFAEIPVIAHQGLASDITLSMRRALLGMRADPAGVKALDAAELAGFEHATDAQYDNVRRIYREN